MFEKASRIKLRFDSERGQLTVEDLWDLPLSSGKVNLNDLAKSASRAIDDKIKSNIPIITDNFEKMTQILLPR